MLKMTREFLENYSNGLIELRNVKDYKKYCKLERKLLISLNKAFLHNVIDNEKLDECIIKLEAIRHY